MPNKIFITGCAKTGTTLVRRLFNSFNLKTYNKSEISLNDLIKSNYDVGKRTANSIFSFKLQPNEIARNLKLISKNNIKIVNVTRNKKDTLKSTNGYVSNDRYEACVNMASTYKNYITCSIKYEDLISNPNELQSELASVLDIQIIHKWSDFPEWFDSSEEDSLIGNEYSLRKIGAPK